MSRTNKRGYTVSKKFDRSCRNHGSCSYCENGRQHNTAVREAAALRPQRGVWARGVFEVEYQNEDLDGTGREYNGY